MSTETNTIWLEAARDNFEEAVSSRNWYLARAVIEDIKDNGFDQQYELLVREYNRIKLEAAYE